MHELADINAKDHATGKVYDVAVHQNEKIIAAKSDDDRVKVFELNGHQLTSFMVVQDNYQGKRTFAHICFGQTELFAFAKKHHLITYDLETN